jgi:hypothetical protein
MTRSVFVLVFCSLVALAFLSACGSGLKTSTPGSTVPPNNSAGTGGANGSGGTGGTGGAGGTSGTGGTSGGLAVSNFVVLGSEQLMFVYRLDNANGTSTLTQQVSVPGMINPDGLASTVDGQYILAASTTYGDRTTLGANALQVYSVNATAGTLTLTGQITEGVPEAIDRVNGNIFAGGNGNSISTYSVTNGVPTLVASVAAGGSTLKVAVNAAKSVVYAKTGNSLQAYSVSTTGQISRLGSSFENFNSYIAVDPQGRFLFTGANNNTVTTWQLAGDGSITGQKATYQVLPQSTTAGAFAVDRMGAYLFVVGYDRITSNRINTDGSLTQTGELVFDNTNVSGALDARVDPSDHQLLLDLYTSPAGAQVFAVNIGPEGKLVSTTSSDSSAGAFSSRGEVDGPGW